MGPERSTLAERVAALGRLIAPASAAPAIGWSQRLKSIFGSTAVCLLTANLSHAAPINIYWTEAADGPDRVMRAAPFAGEFQEIATTDIVRPMGIALDPIEGKVYWGNNNQGLGFRGGVALERANLDGSDREIVLPRPPAEGAIIANVDDITLDLATRDLYWADSRGRIRRVNVDSVESATVFDKGNEAVGIAFDEVNRQLYWSETRRPFQSRINRGPVDILSSEERNAAVEVLIDTDEGLRGPTDLAVDPATDSLYFPDLGSIWRADLDGSNRQAIIMTDSIPRSIALDLSDDKIYWTATNKIQRANLDGTEVEDVLTDLGVLQYLALEFPLEPTSPPDLPPPGTRTILRSDTPAPVDPPRATVVLTHGLQDAIEKPSEFDPGNLWTSFSKRGAAALLQHATGGDVKIIPFIWEEAFRGFDGAGYRQAYPYVPDAGLRLAEELLDELGPDYAAPVHFIGHSLGTAVNAHAARIFLTENTQVTEAQFTILDYPRHLPALLFPDTRDLDIIEFPARFFESMLEFDRSLTVHIDNYFSHTGIGTGDRIGGEAYDHLPDGERGLRDPGTLNARIFEGEGVPNDHSGVHQWYRWTIDPDNPVFLNQMQNFIDFLGGANWEGVFCDDSGAFTPPRESTFGEPFLNASLDPCGVGWAWAISNPNAFPFPEVGAVPPTSIENIALSIEQYSDFGCSLVGETITCPENSSPFATFTLQIPEGASFLAFDFAFPTPGDGDYAALFLEGDAIWVLSGSQLFSDGFANSGPIPIGGANGATDITLALFGVGDPNSVFSARNFTALSSTSVPEPNTIALLLAIGVVFCVRARGSVGRKDRLRLASPGPGMSRILLI